VDRAEIDDSAGPKFQAQAERLREKHAAAAAAAPPLPPLPNGVTHVFVRVRPVLGAERTRIGGRIEGSTRASPAQFEFEAVLPDPARRTVHVLSEKRRIGSMTGTLATQSFAADGVFAASASDDEVYDAAVRPLVERVLAGGCGAVVAYGQTGAGKTHTSTAMQRRAVAALLAGGAARVAVSFYEVIGDKVADLLAADAGERLDDPLTRSLLAVREGARGGPTPSTHTSVHTPCAGHTLSVVHAGADGELVVCGLREVEVDDAGAADGLLGQANAARATAPTASNTRSSRSHAFCVLRPHCPRACAAARESRMGAPTLLLVDLAGERHSHSTAPHSPHLVS